MNRNKQPIGPWKRSSLRTAASLLLALLAASATVCAEDAEVRQRGNQWTLRTSRMERVIALEDGRLLMKRFTDRTTGRELVTRGAVVEEFLAAVAAGTERPSSSAHGWRLLDWKQSKLAQGELQLDITVQRDALQVTKSYVLYPGSSIVREWVTFKNAGSVPLPLPEPCFLNLTAQPGAVQPPDFLWMSGGENNPGSWKLKTEALDPAKPRTFDSYDPFPAEMLGAQQFPGDGIDAKILLNGQQVWPATNWQYVANATVRAPFEFNAEVQAGDKLIFLVNMHGNIGWDTTAFDPTIAYADGETHTASQEFSEQQGKHGWRYQYLENGRFIDLVYYPTPKQWRKEKDNATGTPFVGAGTSIPTAGRMRLACGRLRRRAGCVSPARSAIRATAWGAAPATVSGRGVRVTPRGMRFMPRIRSRAFSSAGIISATGLRHSQLNPGGSVTARLRVAGNKQALAPGESLTTPKAFVGLFHDDLDNAGNECARLAVSLPLGLHARAAGFPAIRMLGYWLNGTGWGQPGAGWTGGRPGLPEHVPQGFPRRRPDALRRRRRLSPRLGLVGPGGRLERPGLPHDHQLSPQIRTWASSSTPSSTPWTRSPGSLRRIRTGYSGDTLDMSRPEVVDVHGEPARPVCRALGRFRMAQRQLLHRRAQRRRHADARRRMKASAD